MKKQRRHYTMEEKAAILRRHLLEKEPISTLCDELGLQPTVFYRWQKEFFENGGGLGQKGRRISPPARSGSLKGECIRPGTPLSFDDAQRLVSGYIRHGMSLQKFRPRESARGTEDLDAAELKKMAIERESAADSPRI
jgi:hypothetical protein